MTLGSFLLGAKVEPLVTRDSLEALVDSVAELRPHDEYLKRRWIGMVMWWHTRSMQARWKYFGLRGLVIAGGVALPVLTTLSARAGWQPDLSAVIAITGAVVAGSAAWEGVANYGDIWREKRRAAEMLKVEGWLFLQRCGKYASGKTHAEVFPVFVAEVETQIAREVGEYLGLFDPSVAAGKKAADDVMKAVADAAVARLRGS